MFNITVTRVDKPNESFTQQGGETLIQSLAALGVIINTICEVYRPHGSVEVREIEEDPLGASRHLGWATPEGFTPFIVITLKDDHA